MNLNLFLPETVLLVVSVVLVSLTLVKLETALKVVRPLMALSSLGIIAATLVTLRNSGFLFESTYKIDLLSQGFKSLLALALFIVVLFSNKPLSIPRGKLVEYYLFLSTASLGMMMITSAADILTLYVSLELSAYSLYLLSALRQDTRTAEASTKYLVFGAATSGILLWGLSLLAGLAGTTSLMEISRSAPTLVSQPAFLIGAVFVSLSFLFKLSSFPVHFWAPDIYESAATPVTTFIATASKAAAVAILIRVFMWLGLTANFITVLGTLAFISMTLGNAAALVQKDVKRLLAYSSIAQAGYILVGLLAGSVEGYSSGFFYAVAYVLMNAGAFFVTLLVARSVYHDNPQISHFDGLAERSPFLALVLLLSLLSLAGIPPLVGFTGKWILFSSAMEKGHWFLVLWGVLNSVVSLFYYLTLIKHAYLEKPKEPSPIRVPFYLMTLGFGLMLSIVLCGLFPNPLIEFTREAIMTASL